MRKKIILVMAAAALVTSMVAGCSNKKVTETTPAETTAPETTKETEPEAVEQTADIVIVGATGSGLAAAIQAVEEGTPADKIVILEAGDQADNEMMNHMEAFNAGDSTYQNNAGVEDDIDKYIAEIKAVGGETANEELTVYLGENAADALDWLVSLGVDLTTISQDNGSSVPRSHRPSDGSPAGAVIMKALEDKVTELKIPFTYNAKVKEVVLNEDGEVSAVKADTKDGEVLINCKSLILANGGFGANADMVKQNNETYAGLASVSPETADGTGIKLAQQAGAAVTGMDQMELYPLVEKEKKTIITEDLYRSGAILVNKEGQRFVSETETENNIGKAIFSQTDGTGYLVFDENVKKSLSAVDAYISAGIVKEADSVEALAKALGVDSANLVNESKEAPGFASGKFYGIEVAPAIYYTLGGVTVNTCAEVLTEDEGIIPGLFAAGEIIGGVHGANVLDGNILTDMVVFGRTAGVEASAYAAQ